MPQSSVFPIFIKAEYDGSSKVFEGLERATRDSIQSSKTIFEQGYREVETIINNALIRGIDSTGKIDLDTSSLRQAAAESKLAEQAFANLERVSASLAQETGDASQATRLYIQLLSANRIEQEKITADINTQISTYTRLQAGIDQVTSRNNQLAQSYRDVFREQARAAQSEADQRRAREQFTDFIAPNINGGSTNSAQASAAVFQNATRAQDELARSAANLRAQLDPMFEAQQRFDNELRIADELLEQGAISTREYAQAQQFARDELNFTARSLTDNLTEQERATRGSVSSNQTLERSTRAVRQATLQSGQQLQDIAISLYSGQRASIVFAQQLPQLAFAFSILDGQSNKTLATIGRLGTFLAGPWGLAVGLAAGVLGTFVASLFDTEEQTDDTNKATRSFTDVLEDQKTTYEELTRAAKDYADQLEDNRGILLHSLRLRSKLIESRIDELEIERDQAQLSVNKSQDNVNQVIETSQILGKSGFGEVGKGVINLGVAAGAKAFLQSEQEKLKGFNDALFQQRRALKENNISLAQEIALFNGDDAHRIKVNAEIEINNLSESIDDVNELAKEIEKVNLRKDAALDAIRETNKISKSESGEQTAFISPVAGRQSSGFGTRIHPITGKRQFHAGADIAAPKGTPVLAPADGVVIETGTVGGYGKVVFIDHGGGTITRLAHLSRNNQFNEGDRVSQGDVVGNVGSTGRSTGNHLHFEVRRNGKAVNPNQRTFRTDSVQTESKADKIRQAALAAAAKETQRLARISDSAAESVLRINERYDEQPRLVDQSAQSVRKLQSIIDEINDPKNFDADGKNLVPRAEAILENAEKAKVAAGNAVNDALDRDIEQENERLDVQRLIAEGREYEAEVIQKINDLDRDKGIRERLEAVEDELWIANDILEAADSTNKERQEAEETVKRLNPEHEKLLALHEKLTGEAKKQVVSGHINEEIAARRNENQQRYLSLVGSTRGALEDLFSGGSATDFFDTIRTGFEDIRGQLLVENIFGNSLRQLEEFNTRNDPINVSTRNFVDQSDKASDALKGFTETLDQASSSIVSADNDNAPGTTIDENGDIKVIGDVGEVDISNRTIDEFTKEWSRALVEPLVAKLDDTFDTSFFSSLSGVFTGALEGFARAGGVGAGLGGVAGIFNTLSENAEADGKNAKVFAEISSSLNTALDGAQTGDQTSQLLSAIGINTSRTGGQIGGGIGQAVFGPIGGLVGGLLGGVFGGLFRSTPEGAAVITGQDQTQFSGSSRVRQDLDTVSGSVQSNLQEIADRLDGTVGSFRVSIGRREDHFRVSASGSSRVGDRRFPDRAGADLLYDGTDEAEAVRIAVLNALQDGAIDGIREGAERLIRQANDIEQGIADALSFQGVFDQLEEIRDPVGAAINDLNDEFEELQDIFRRAGASTEEYAELEELYRLRRADAIERATEQEIGALQDLLDQLTIGDSGLSLRQRLANAQEVFNPLAEGIANGEDVDYDEFAEAGRNVLDLIRQIEGSQVGYFDFLDRLTDLTEQAIEREENVIGIATGSSTDLFSNDNNVDSNAMVSSAITDQTDALSIAINNGFNAQLGALAQISQQLTLSNSGIVTFNNRVGF